MGGAVRHPVCTGPACHCRSASWMQCGSCGSICSIMWQKLCFCKCVNQDRWMQHHEHVCSLIQSNTVTVSAQQNDKNSFNIKQFNNQPPQTSPSRTVSTKTELHKLQVLPQHYCTGLHSIFMILSPPLYTATCKITYYL